MVRESPVPTCMPFITGMGITRVKRWIRPVAESMKTLPATKSPAEVIWPGVKFWESGGDSFHGLHGEGDAVD